jgi:hypothetical protein
MKTLLLIPAILCMISSCEKEKKIQVLTPQDPTVLINLISNSEFEQNGQPSFAGWNYSYGPCCADTFSADVHPGGGNNSLKLEPMWFPAEGAVETYITGLTGNHQYQLNFYAKCIDVVNPVSNVSIYMKGFSITSVQSLNFINTQWTPYSLTTGQMQLQPSDTMVIKLSADRTEVVTWQVLFDNVELYQLP